MWTGMPSVFIRIAGCNLHCSWCDTPHALTTDRAQNMSCEEICETITSLPQQHIVITGGEPTLYPDELSELCSLLHAAGKCITLETNATIFVPCTIHTASLSPKLPGTHTTSITWNVDVIAQYIEHAPHTQIKIVVASDADVRTAVLLAQDIDLPAENVFLMPQSHSYYDVVDAAEWLIPLCATHGFRFGARVHTLMWNNTLGR